jgi:GH18 family chitinase
VVTVACTPRYVEQTEEAWMPHASAVDGLLEGEFESDPVNFSSTYVPLRDPADRPDVTVYGFWPHWGDPLDTLPWDQLTDVAIFSVTLNSDGSLADEHFWHDNVAEALALAAPYDVSIHLTVTSFDDGVMGSVLPSASKRAAAVDRLATLVNDAGAHGVNIDFEGMDSHLSDELVLFTQELKARVGEVTLATPAADWNGSYDYDELAAASDGLFIMAYDYSWSGGDPGPVAPLDGSTYGIIDLRWTLADYLDAGTTPDDLIMGLPLYGRGWSTTNNSIPGDSTGSSWPEVFTEAVQTGIDHGRHYDPDAEVAYAFPSSTSQVFYDDTASLTAKIEWALAEGVSGIGFWALTYDDTDRVLWGEIDQLTHSAPAVTVPTLGAPAPAEAGVDNTVLVSGLAAGHTVHLLSSEGSGSYAVAGCSLVVDLDAPTLLGSGTTDAAGTLSMTFPVDLADAGKAFTLVAVDVDACEATPGVKAVFTEPMGTGAGTTPAPTVGTVPAPDDEVCYPGEHGAYDVCATLEPAGSQGSDYDYPSTSMANYEEPTHLLRLSDIPGGTKLAPNFTRDELAQEWKGDWGVVQVHAVERLQDLRDVVGALVVTSGYRSPGYNDGVGGAELSRHMYGDAFDLQPTSVSLSSLADHCSAHGAGFVSVYTSHVHCDWRDDAQEPAFYGTAAPPPPTAARVQPTARLQPSPHGTLLAEVEGFDCGEPLREWTAYDTDGHVLSTGEGAEFVPPTDAARVEVVVGRVLTEAVELAL